MVYSMTGYGRFRETVNGRDITVEVKSVNHRYFEYSSRIPRIYGFLDDHIKPLIQQYMSRGKVDVFMWIEDIDSESSEVVINHGLASNYLSALREISQKYNITDNTNSSTIARFPDVISVKPVEAEEDEVWETVKVVLEQSLERFVEMRKREGDSLYKDIFQRAHNIGEKIEIIENKSPEIVKAHMEKMRTRMTELLEDATVDEERLLTEAAIFADKTAVDEETVRLRSHLDQLLSMLESEEPIGRKLDFLIQEINRETNTIGSKSQDIEITKIVVDIKAEIEKIREQVQNIE